jgi:hypothetical protein
MAAGERLGIGIVRLLWASDSDTHSSGKLQANSELTNTSCLLNVHITQNCAHVCVCVCVCVSVLTCLQDTSVPELSSVHPVPHVAPSPTAQSTPGMSETTKWIAECSVVRSTNLCDF